MRTALCDMFGIEFPIFAFSHCRDVVAAVSRAGGLGVLGAVAFQPDELEIELQWIDEHIDGKPYGVDIVIPKKYLGRDKGDFGKMDLESMLPKPHRDWLDGLLTEHEVPELPDHVEKFDGMLGWSQSGGRAAVEVAMNHPIKLLVNALGPPPPDIIGVAHERGIKVAALIGKVKQAVAQKEAGVDIIIASGTEAGGHTGEIGSMVLLPQVVDAVHPTPVLGAGGIATGRQMAAAMALGAQGVWTGSVWLTTEESDCVPALKDKLLAADSTQTVRSRCISGKPARQLVTDYTLAWDSEACPGTLPMPLQFLLTAEATQRITRFSHTDHARSADLLGTPVGQVVGQMNKVKPVATVIYDMVSEYIDAVSGLHHQLEKAGAD